MPRKAVDSSKSGSVAAMAENLKRSITEVCVLHLLSARPYYIGELTEELSRRSGGFLDLVCPYGLFYRMIDFDYIAELKKKRAPDGRRREYYELTDKGREYLDELMDCYRTFSTAISNVLQEEGAEDE